MYNALDLQSDTLSEMPEFKLWYAVLNRAIVDLKVSKCGADNRIETTRQEAVRWFKSDENEVGSFLWICDILDLCPNLTRKTYL